jgi:hypothetical protein
LIGAAGGGIFGGVGGLVVGLQANPRTAWFAIFELGIPSAILGGVIGLVCGLMLCLIRVGSRRTNERFAGEAES